MTKCCCHFVTGVILCKYAAARGTLSGRQDQRSRQSRLSFFPAEHSTILRKEIRMKKLRTKLLSLLSAAAMLFTALPAVSASADDLTQKSVFITYTGQVVDSFMGVDAVYSTYYSWSGYYSCAAYIDKFYNKFWDVNLYDINSYKGKPHVYYPISGHTAELKTVSQPIPGDIMQDKEYSHVAIVKAVNGSQVTLIEQNWKWDDWATGDLVCTVNRKVNVSDNYFYRLYIDGKAQTLPGSAPTLSSAAASSITRDGFTVKASAKDDTSIDRFEITTYPQSKGTSAAKKVTVRKSGTSASASTAVKVSDFGNLSDTYVSVVDVYNTGGMKATKTIYTVVSRTAPVISGVKVTNKTAAGYTVKCTVSPAQGTVKTVKFPTWTSYKATDDLNPSWSTGTVCNGTVSGSTASFTVKTADHNKELGEYNTYIYAYDSFGNCSTKAVQVNLSKAVDGLDVAAISAQNFTGKALTPAVTVSDNGRVLARDVDYTLTYTNNTAVGKASVRITGMGDYSGSRIVNFNIKPAKVTGMKVVKATTSSVQIRWNENANADGYYVYRRVNGSWVKAGSTSELTYTVTGLPVGENFEFAVIAHKKVAGINYNSRYPTALKAVTKTDKVKTLTVSEVSGMSKITWSKLDKTDGYAIYTSTDGKTYTRLICIDNPSAVSYVLSNTVGRTYVKVRGYKLIKTTHYYGAYSPTVTIE